MASASLIQWQTKRIRALDEIESARNSVRGAAARGGQYATQQINRAYVLLLSSEFQGFCRDLHTEAVNVLVRNVQPASFQQLIASEFVLHRQLERGNVSPGTIAADFNRFGLNIWEELNKLTVQNAKRQLHLEQMNEWRNAIAHQDFHSAKFSDKWQGRTILPFQWVKKWRSNCNYLASDLDTITDKYLYSLTGTRPW